MIAKMGPAFVYACLLAVTFLPQFETSGPSKRHPTDVVVLMNTAGHTKLVIVWH